MHPEWRRVARLVRPHRGSLALAFAEAIANRKRALPHDDLHRALAHAAHGQAIRLAAPRWAVTVAADLQGRLLAIHAATAHDAHGRLMRRRLSKAKPKRVAELSAEYARRHAGALIDDLSAEARDVITETIASGVEGALTPRQMIRAIEDVIGLNDRQATALNTYRNDLIEAGEHTDAQVEQLAGAYADRLLGQRAEMIERTETIAAANRGIEAGWQQAVKEGFLSSTATRIWIAGPDACEICLSIADNDPIGLEEPFVDDDGEEYDGPPAHPHCGCTEGLADAGT